MLILKSSFYLPLRPISSHSFIKKKTSIFISILFYVLLTPSEVVYPNRNRYWGPSGPKGDDGTRLGKGSAKGGNEK